MVIWPGGRRPQGGLVVIGMASLVSPLSEEAEHHDQRCDMRHFCFRAACRLRFNSARVRRDRH